VTRQRRVCWLALAGIVALVGCGTSRQFTVVSEPAGALIVEHSQPSLDDSVLLESDGETPGTAKVVFFGETPHYVTVQKRGYEPATTKLDEQSPEVVNLELEPIPGVPREPPDQEAARRGRYLLMPVDVELQMKTGVGAVGHLEPAPLEAERLTGLLRTELAERLAGSGGRLQAAWSASPQLLDAWGQVAAPLHDVLRKLRPGLLAYRSLPPLLDEVDAFAKVRQAVRPEDGDGRYLLYVWCRAVTETKGRKVGNVLAMLAGAVVEGVNPSYASISNPAVFAPSSGAMLLFYVIDAATSEVVLIVPYQVDADLTKERSMAAVSDLISRFPNLE